MMPAAMKNTFWPGTARALQQTGQAFMAGIRGSVHGKQNKRPYTRTVQQDAA
jgi:hypothetical protein